MRKVFITAGHGGKDTGAVALGYTEAALTIEFRNLVISECAKLGVKVQTDKDTNALAETLKWLKGLILPNSIAIDIHLNAGPRLANGTEIIVPEKCSAFEMSIAKALLNVFVNAGFRDRGVKSELLTARKRLGWMRPVCENILIEVCFITNRADMVLYSQTKKLLAANVAGVVKQFVNE